MAATIAFYKRGDPLALRAWNGGEGANTGGCIGKVGVYTNEMPTLTPERLQAHTLARNINRTARPWAWGANHSALRGPIWFRGSGALESPWGEGSWGSVPSPWRNDSLHVHLRSFNQTYLLMFLSEKWSFVAVRCSDEHVSYGRLMVEDESEIPEKRLVW